VRVMATDAALCVLTATLNASTRPPTPPLPTSTATCSPADLAVSSGAHDAAMGSRVLTLQLRNAGSTAHTELDVLDVDRQHLTVSTTHGVHSAVPDPGPSAVALAPGRSAEATVSWRDTVTADGNPSVEGSYLVVTPEACERSPTAPAHLDVGPTGTIDVTAWHLRRVE